MDDASAVSSPARRLATEIAFRRAIVGLVLALGASPTAATDRPSPATFAFDWLRPKTARCEAVSEALLKRFRRCEREQGAFGLSDRVHVCRVDDRSEYLVFETRDACARNLETMRANAP